MARLEGNRVPESVHFNDDLTPGPNNQPQEGLYDATNECFAGPLVPIPFPVLLE